MEDAALAACCGKSFCKECTYYYPLYVLCLVPLEATRLSGYCSMSICSDNLGADVDIIAHHTPTALLPLISHGPLLCGLLLLLLLLGLTPGCQHQSSNRLISISDGNGSSMPRFIKAITACLASTGLLRRVNFMPLTFI